MAKITAIVGAIDETELIALRREFHKIPELGFEEFKTAHKIAAYLERLGLSVSSGLAGTGVVALLKGGRAGKTVMYRADMDALPIEEANDADYRSLHPGKMHACGHDAHVSMALMTAKILKRVQNQLSGNIKFVFQPAEETVNGAKKMIQAGVLDAPKVAMAFGFHVWNHLPVGKIGYRYGPVMAASNQLDVLINGKQCHGAMPNEGNDTIVAAAQFIQQAQAIVSRRLKPTDSAVISFGKINGGYARNILPATVALEGIVRTFTSTVDQVIDRELRNIAAGIEKSSGVKIELSNMRTAPAVVNDPEITALAKASAERIVGADNLVEAEPSLGSEDMAYFLKKVPGCFLSLAAVTRKLLAGPRITIPNL